MLRRLLQPVITYPKITLLAVFGVTFLLALGMARLRLETDIRSWIPESNHEIQFDDHVREVFAEYDRLVIGVEATGPAGIYTPEVLALIDEISTRLEQIDGVLLGEVQSLATADNIIGTADGLEVEPFMDRVPQTPAELAALRAAVRENPIYNGQIVSKDDQAAMISAKVTEEASRERLYRDTWRMLNSLPLPPHTRLVLAGRPALEGALAQLIKAELRFMPLLSNGCMILMLALVMRSGRGVLLPILVVLLANCTAYGIMGATGVKLYSMSTAIVPLLVAMGVADGIHLINSYAEHHVADPDADRATIVGRTLDDMTLPVIMTSLTTAGGFLALGFAPILPIKYFGIFTAVGILGAMVFSLTVIPAGLMMVRLKAPRHFHARREGPGHSLTDWFLRGLAALVVRHRAWVLAGSLLVIAGGAYEAWHLQIDTALSMNISKGHPVLAAHDYLNTHFEGNSELDVVYEGAERDAVKAPAVLHALDELQTYAEQLDMVGGSTSIVEFIKRMHQVMNGDDPAYYAIPDSRELVAQYLLLYSLSGDPDDFDEVVDYDYRETRVRLHLRSDHSALAIPVIETMQDYVNKTFPPGKRPRFAGGSNNGRVMQELVVGGQLLTLVISVLTVYVLTTLMFRSAFGGFLASLPVLIATVLNFGMMSRFGIPLGIGNSTLAAIGMGIGIDYAIHYLARFRRLAAAGLDLSEAAATTTTTVGRSILFNALVVAAGYMVNLASQFPPTEQLGTLVSFNMLTSFLGAMLVMPTLILVLRPRFVQEPARQETLLAGTPAEATQEL